MFIQRLVYKIMKTYKVMQMYAGFIVFREFFLAQHTPRPFDHPSETYVKVHCSVCIGVDISLPRG